MVSLSLPLYDIPLRFSWGSLGQWDFFFFLFFLICDLLLLLLLFCLYSFGCIGSSLRHAGSFIAVRALRCGAWASL